MPIAATAITTVASQPRALSKRTGSGLISRGHLYKILSNPSMSGGSGTRERFTRKRISRWSTRRLGTVSGGDWQNTHGIIRPRNLGLLFASQARKKGELPVQT